ncbi:MAG: hypothetical protein KIT33_09755 [Candidatus Kapabacteria bacterium]|nr:hypothetical protein [Ignavibacteriota bacterium]MCW5885242.1 hypothetical protein [Candidatus Kapabacteria bacterium]
MYESKAIRPEIKGLFDTIRQQAIRYAEAFDLLDKQRLEYENYILQLKATNEDVYRTTSNELFNLKQKYEELIKLVKLESSQISQKYSELKDLKQLQTSYFSALESIKVIQTSLEQQFNILKKGVDDFTTHSEDIKNSADTKVDDFLKSSFDRIDEMIKTQYKKFEDKIAHKVRHIEGKIINNDEIYWAFQNKYKEDLKNVLTEFDDFRRQFLKSEFDRNNEVLFTGVSSQDNLNDVTNKLKQIDATIQRLEENVSSTVSNSSKTLRTFDTSSASTQSSDFNTINKLTAHDKEINSLKKEISDFSKSTSMIKIAAFLSLTAALLSIILNFLL